MMMFASILALAVAATTALPPLPQIKMTSDERWTMVWSLKRQVGGNFILAGVAKADGTCRNTGTCITKEGLEADPATRDARSVNELVSNASVNGKGTTALVVVRGLRQWNPYYPIMQVLASVYDPKTEQWTDMVGTFDSGASSAPGMGAQNFMRWRVAPGFAR